MDPSFSSFIFPRETLGNGTDTTYNPFPWTVARNDLSQDGCPSRSAVLVTFAVTNIINAIIAVILGNRRVVHFLSRGMLGKDNGSKHYRFLWIVTVGLNLGSSAVNAFIMKNTEGYGERFNVAQVMLFYTTRPRITWIFGALITTPFARRRKNEKHWSADWVAFAYTQAFAEIVLQAICMYTLVTANSYSYKQQVNGVAVPETVSIFKLTKGDIGLVEILVGAVGWIAVFTCMVFLVLALWTLTWWRATGDKRDASARNNTTRKRDWCFLALVLTLACNWLFWDGYLREFPQEYCPPKLTLQATVWVLFTAVGMPIGAGF